MSTIVDAPRWLEANKQQFIEMADEIWTYSEIRWQEFKSSKLQADYLEEAGFDVTWDVGGISTAFVAEWTNGDGSGPHSMPNGDHYNGTMNGGSKSSSLDRNAHIRDMKMVICTQSLLYKHILLG